MPEVVLVDTCVLLNILDVPGFNQDREDVLADLTAMLDADDVTLLLPFAAIIEAGNHIAQLPDGRVRRDVAAKFCQEVCSAIDGNSPWTPTQAMEIRDLRSWLVEYPDHAMRGVGLADLSILKEWEAACVRHPRHRVRVWSLDGHLMGLDHTP